MNRLWVRFALVIGTVLLVMAMLPLLFFAAMASGWLAAPEGMLALRSWQETLPPEQQAWIANQIEEAFNQYLTRSLVSSLTVSVILGTLLSWMLAAPLRNLEAGARSIATQDLSHRVPVRGSREIKAVAVAFNEMAGRLEQAELLRRHLLADVAHELRNPLHVLRGNLRAILDDVYPLSKEEIARLLDQTDHLTALVADLHVLAQAEAQQLPLAKEPADVAALVKETAVAFKPVAAVKSVHLQVELLGAVPQLTVDASRLRQALHNLLSNALRHSDEGGSVWVRVEEVNGRVQIRVQDDGAGIAPEHLPHVFDRFYRTESDRSRDSGGVGLGLAITKALVEAHGGKVQVESAGLGRGSEFTMMLPGRADFQA